MKLFSSFYLIPSFLFPLIDDCTRHSRISWTPSSYHLSYLGECPPREQIRSLGGIPTAQIDFYRFLSWRRRVPCFCWMREGPFSLIFRSGKNWGEDVWLKLKGWGMSDPSKNQSLPSSLDSIVDFILFSYQSRNKAATFLILFRNHLSIEAYSLIVSGARVFGWSLLPE